MFLSFSSQEERRAYGGSDFVEIQFCTLPVGTKPADAVRLKNLRSWEDSSLYVADDHAFFEEYQAVFTGGYYANGEKGTMDLTGVNYYPAAMLEGIIAKVRALAPKDWETLAAWLEKAKEYNGFYIFGL